VKNKVDGIESCFKEKRRGTWQNEELTSREVGRPPQQASRQQTNDALQQKELLLKKRKHQMSPKFLY